MINLDNIDPLFKVEIDFNSSSAAPDIGIWHAQHTCVAEGFSLEDKPPSNPALSVIKNQLKVKHWSVLNFGFVVLHFSGFPHDTAMQWVRHQDSHFDIDEVTNNYSDVTPLCQSMRYTGDRMIAASKGEIDIEQVFYFQPVGEYKTRTGSYYITQEERSRYFSYALDSAKEYALLVKNGKPEEVARRCLYSGYRQNFTMAGTLRAIMHALDQRTLADAQYESQVLAQMVVEKLKKWQPEFFTFYEETRAGKNLLAP